MKLLIDDGLSIHGGTGIGQHSYYLYKQLLCVIPGSVELIPDSPAYQLLNKFPRIIKRPAYIILANSLIPINRRLQGNNIIHFTNHYVPAYKPAGLLYAVTIHDLAAFVAPETLPKNYRKYAVSSLLQAVKRGDLIITTTETIKKQIIDTLKAGPAKIAVCGSGIRPVFIKNNIINPSGTGDDNYILFVGTLEKRKNITTLLKAVHIVIKAGYDIKLHLVGRKGFGWNHIDLLIKELQLRDSILVKGYITDEELFYEYSGARIFVFPSFYEGFGTPLLEAMACNTPVIASDIPAFREVAQDAALFYGKPGDYRRLAESIKTILDSPALQDEFICKGKKRFKYFSWHIIAQKHIDAYKRIF